MSIKSRFFVLFITGIITSACTAQSTYKDDHISGQNLKRSNFVSAYFHLISFAQSEMKVDFSTESCSQCNVRVIEAHDIPKYIDINRTGFDEKKLKTVQQAIRTNSGRAVVLTHIPDKRTGRSENLVFLPMDKEQFASCPEATNAAFLTTAPQAAACGLRTFGFKGSGPHCGVCAIGLCCGTCKCKSCNVFGIERPGLELPERFDKLFDRSVSLKDFPLNVDLVK